MTPAKARARAKAEAEDAIAKKRAVYAQLVSEPFCLPMAAIARLTDRQIREIYGHKRDDRGSIEPPPESPLVAEPQTREEEKALFFAVCVQFGMPLEKVQAEWLAKRGPDP